MAENKNNIIEIFIAGKPGEKLTSGVPWRTVPELLFEKKRLLPDIQRLLVLHKETIWELT
jgi:hypothetical protein